MNSKQRDTFDKILTDPVTANLKWNDFVSLMKALDVKIEEGSGSRVMFDYNTRRLYLHRPHPAPVLKKYAVREIRQFFIDINAKSKVHGKGK